MPNNHPQPNLREQFVSETIPVGFPWRLFIFSFTLFIFSLFVFFGLRFGYGAYIDKRAQELDRKINDLALEVSQEDQQSFIQFYSQLMNLKKVLGRHTFTANVFNFLEENTLGKVYYTEAEFSKDNSLTLRGKAADSQTLADQLAIFDGRAEIDRVQLNEMNAVSEGLTFELTIFFNPAFFQQPTLTK